MNGLRPLSALSTEERDWIANFLGKDGVLPLYFDTAVEDLARGIDNRLVLIGRERNGLILGITFAGLEAFTIVGTLNDVELRSTYTRPMPCELHVTAELAAHLRPRLGDRLVAELAMRTETCTIGTRVADPRCQVITRDDSDRLMAFYDRYNPRHVFSPWMLPGAQGRRDPARDTRSEQDRPCRVGDDGRQRGCAQRLSRPWIRPCRGQG
jgi:hypothetical protein